MKQKRFSRKELATWMFETAKEMVDEKDIAKCYWYSVSPDYCVVMSWSDCDDYEMTPNNICLIPSGKKYGSEDLAYGMVASLRVSEPISQWGNLPSDFLYAVGDDDNGYEGGITLAATDLNDLRSTTKDLADYLSQERTELLYH